ncbi:hypothetical protein Tco_0254049, partial [Tanacetum coccineum]
MDNFLDLSEDPLFQPGFTPLNSNQSENEAVKNVAHKYMSLGGSKHAHINSLATSPKKFISIGQAMGFGMKG